MRKVHSFILIVLAFAVTGVSAQQDTVSRHWIHAGYFGENITHHGLTGGFGMALWNGIKSREKVHQHQLYMESNLSFFIHPQNHAFLALMPDLGYRYVKNSSWYLQFAAGGGVLRTVYLARTFESNGEGDFEERFLAGKWALGSTVSAGFGKSVNKGKTLFIYSKVRLINEHFYNQRTLFRPVFQIGALKAF